MWSSDVHTFAARQSFHQSLHQGVRLFLLSGSSRLLTCLRNVIHEKTDIERPFFLFLFSFFFLGQRWQRWKNVSHSHVSTRPSSSHSETVFRPLSAIFSGKRMMSLCAYESRTLNVRRILRGGSAIATGNVQSY